MLPCAGYSVGWWAMYAPCCLSGCIGAYVFVIVCVFVVVWGWGKSGDGEMRKEIFGWYRIKLYLSVYKLYQMIKKRETCLYCGEKMESITAKKKFCSALHKLYWHRENKFSKGIYQQLKDNAPVFDASSTNIKKSFYEILDGTASVISEEPKWKLKNPIMKVPDGLTSIQKKVWVANWRKENIK